MTYQAGATIGELFYPFPLNSLTIRELREKICEAIKNEFDYNEYVMTITNSKDRIVKTDKDVESAVIDDFLAVTVRFDPKPPSPVKYLQVKEMFPDKCILTWDHEMEAGNIYLVTGCNNKVLHQTSVNIAKIDHLNPETNYQFNVLVVRDDFDESKEIKNVSDIPPFKSSEIVSLLIQTPPTSVANQALINSNVVADPKSIVWSREGNKKFKISWASPKQFCGKISYDLYNKNQYLGRVTQLPCYLDVEETTGSGKLSLAVQAVFDLSTYKSEKTVSVQLGSNESSSIVYNQIDEMKSPVIELKVEYRGAKKVIPISADMKYEAFMERIAQFCNLKQLRDGKKIEKSVDVTLTCSQTIFKGKNFFHIKNPEMWTEFWKTFATQFAFENIQLCYITFTPQVIQSTISPEGNTILEFTSDLKEGFEAEIQLDFESGESETFYAFLTKSPDSFSLFASEKLENNFSTSVKCKFHVRSTAFEGLSYGEWSREYTYKNNLNGQ